MKNHPKIIELVVQQDLCIGCGVCVYKCPNNALEMGWNENGFLIPKLIGSCDSEGKCVTVCPFDPYPDKEVRTEDELANIFLTESSKYDDKVGKYQNMYTGYSYEYRNSSSSGGIATYILSELLENRIVSHILCVKENSTENGFEYSIIDSKNDLLSSSKTKYYPVTLSSVFEKINKIEGTFALVGVACFIKAVRKAQVYDPALKEKIKFLVGIICGGVKSNFFTEYLSNKIGFEKKNYKKIEYRIKDYKSSAGDYSFGCSHMSNNDRKEIKMRSVGDMWGTGLFKANACDFCDDVSTELADISLGDAWISPYILDGRGTNIIITRTSIGEKILNKGVNEQKIYLEKVSVSTLIQSQKGSFNHRQNAIHYRIKKATKAGYLIPPKRDFNSNAISLDSKIIQLLRSKIRKKSLEIWKELGNAQKFDLYMEKDLKNLRKITKFNHLKKAILSNDIFGKILRRIKK